MSEPQRISVGPEAQGERLDRVLAALLERSRNQVQQDIAAGRVLVDARPARPSQRLEGGEEITVVEPDRDPADALEPEDESLTVLFEDPDLAVVDKPAGLAVHPGAGRSRGTLCHRLLARYPEIREVGHPQRPGVVHRLDLGTSGAIVVARNEESYRSLSAAFAGRRVVKEYLAAVHGSLPDRLRVEAPIGRHPTERKRMTVREGGRAASTEAEALDRAARDRLTLAWVLLHTGRTHQIRVHFKHVGHPLVGDPVYGEARWKELQGSARTAVRAYERPALHAWRLTLTHPRTGEPCSWTAAPATDLVELWRSVGGREIGPLLAERPAPSPEGAPDQASPRST